MRALKVRRPKYVPALDRWERRWIGAVAARKTDPVYAFYRQRGYRVFSYRDVARVPSAVREELVADIRRRWTRCLMAESLLAGLAGPVGWAAGFPALVMTLSAWGTELGLAYGLNMAAPDAQEQLQQLLARELDRILPQPVAGGWTRRAAGGIRSALEWNFGHDVWAANVMMTRVRRNWERQLSRSLA